MSTTPRKSWQELCSFALSAAPLSLLAISSTTGRCLSGASVASDPEFDPTGSKALSEGLATIRSVQTGQHVYIYNATSYGKYVVSQHENYRTALTLASRQLRAGLELKF